MLCSICECMLLTSLSSVSVCLSTVNAFSGFPVVWYGIQRDGEEASLEECAGTVCRLKP